MINIDVSGRSGSGKSTVALVVAQALIQAGFDVDVKFLDGEDMAHVRNNIDAKVEHIAKRETICITEKYKCISGLTY